MKLTNDEGALGAKSTVRLISFELTTDLNALFFSQDSG
jgi:hypothetical protein